MLGVVPANARAVLKPPQGHLVDRLCRACRDLCGPHAVRMPQEVEDDLGVHHVDPQPYCRGREAATPSLSGTMPGMATAHVRVSRQRGRH